MVRNLRIAMTAAATAAFVAGGALPAAWAATSLLVPGGTAFAVLGHSCGGIQQQALATGFDATTGDPVGDVYLQTRCGGSGRGGGYHTTTYSAWVGMIWDYTGAMVSYQVLASAPANLDPTLSVVDSFGNQLDNQLNAVNVLPANCTVGNTTYCSYRAYLTLAPTFVPPPIVSSIAVTSGPASGGTSVSITGTGLTGATAVLFGATPAASYVVNSDTSITAVSPVASAGTVDLTVTTAGGTSAVVAGDEFTFIGAPAISGVGPNTGPVDGGTEVTITGDNLADVSEVLFGETPTGFVVNGDGSITATSPPAEAPDNVRIAVVSLGGTSPATPADEFTYTASAAGCTVGCSSSVQCGKLRGNLATTMTVSKCLPKSPADRRASFDLQTSTFTWKPNGDTTIGNLIASSPGQGACKTGSVEYDLSGTVADGTSTYTAIGDAVSAQICVNPKGKVSLVRGTALGL